MGEHLSEARTRMHEKDAAQSCPGDCKGMDRLHCRICRGCPHLSLQPQDADLLWQVGDWPVA